MRTYEVFQTVTRRYTVDAHDEGDAVEQVDKGDVSAMGSHLVDVSHTVRPEPVVTVRSPDDEPPGWVVLFYGTNADPDGVIDEVTDVVGPFTSEADAAGYAARMDESCDVVPMMSPTGDNDVPGTRAAIPADEGQDPTPWPADEVDRVVTERTTTGVLDWVGGDRRRAEAAQEAERGRTAPRAHLLAALDRVAAR